MNKDSALFLQDILECIEKIEEYTAVLDFRGFESNTQIQDSVLRRLEIIGEAAKNVPSSFRGKHPQIPWKKISGMWDVLIHSYSGVSLRTVWEVIRKDIPTLKQETKQLLKKQPLQ